jgi:hypothetical protein
MVNQRKVQPIGLIKNLKINLARCEYKIYVIVLNMGDEMEIYSMFLGRSWLKQKRPKYVDGYDWEEGLSNEEEQ